MTDDNVVARIESERDDITRLLAGKVGTDKFIRAAATVLRTTPALLKCKPSSVMACLLVAAQLGLEPGGPLPGVYLVPYGQECTLIISVHGFRKLLYSAGALDVQTYLIRKGDEIGQESTPEGVRVQWKSADPLDDARETVGALAEIRFPGGGIIQELMSKAQLDKRAKMGGPVWRQWRDEMDRKTVLRAAAKSALAIEADQAVISGDLDSRTIRHVEGGAEARVKSLDELEAGDPDDAPDESDPGWVAEQERQEDDREVGVR
jgi:recombination protein RecT